MFHPPRQRSERALFSLDRAMGEDLFTILGRAKLAGDMAGRRFASDKVFVAVFFLFVGLKFQLVKDGE